MNAKTVAWILLIILIFENTILFISYMSLINEEEKTYECYYDICEEYPNAWFEDEICTCYEYDLLGELVVAKEKWIK